MDKVLENIDLATVEIVPAIPEQTKRFGSADLARKRNLDPAHGSVTESGEIVFTIPAEPRGLTMVARVNGREDVSTILDRDQVAVMAREWARTGPGGTILDKPLPERVAYFAKRFPVAGEPPAPKREEAAAVFALRDDFHAFIASRAWTLPGKSRAKRARERLV